jgi:hypothetical protein
MTALEFKCLTAIATHDCNANSIADILWPHKRKRMSLRAAQYVHRRLISQGWVHRHFEEYTGRLGRRIICGVRYEITRAGKEALKANES